MSSRLSARRRPAAGWLIGCDGAASTTRHVAGIGFPGVKLSERFLLADVRLDWDLDRSGTTGWIHPYGMIGVMPMPDDSGRLWRVIAYDPGQPNDKPTEQEILDGLMRILPERTGRDVAHRRHGLAVDVQRAPPAGRHLPTRSGPAGRRLRPYPCTVRRARNAHRAG